MKDLCDSIVLKFDGSLKGEHGTGRNVAPFVELEWGREAVDIMRQLKVATHSPLPNLTLHQHAQCIDARCFSGSTIGRKIVGLPSLKEGRCPAKVFESSGIETKKPKPAEVCVTPQQQNPRFKVKWHTSLFPRFTKLIELFLISRHISRHDPRIFLDIFQPHPPGFSPI